MKQVSSKLLRQSPHLSFLGGGLIIVIIAATGFVIVAGIKAPQMVRPLLDMMAYSLDKKEFWGKLENGLTLIKIPKREINNYGWKRKIRKEKEAKSKKRRVLIIVNGAK